ncbi:hypothetical protein L1F30_11495 [Simiduia sp. 21SJ11W-1]|uniref:hypothetical protein n=1 Tax=Simiduia sp. 21SJ11W-1 TaxID=2909669 RepID=UPI0020A1331C|nr:hypothetical protein [Simiduia sp. 21SJ11W-1]UTA46783.1 hypothetical protein L1F30_11495 [Simiduia sp. 21SJ11W-1]
MKAHVHNTLLNSLAPHMKPAALKLGAHNPALDTRVHETLTGMRQRMANLEQTLGETASQKHELETELMSIKGQFSQQHLISKNLQVALTKAQAQIADLEATLAVYRRKAMHDEKEIELLKTQIFA